MQTRGQSRLHSPLSRGSYGDDREEVILEGDDVVGQLTGQYVPDIASPHAPYKSSRNW